MNFRFVFLLNLAILVLLSTTPSTFAARILRTIVTKDGESILKITFSDDSNPYPERVWRSLAKKPAGFGEDFQAKFIPSKSDPLLAHLEGDLVIRIHHSLDNPPIVAAKTSKLTLSRTDAADDRWFLTEEEVERIAKENGIPEPSPFALSEGERLQLGLRIGGIVLGVAMALFIAWGLWSYFQSARTKNETNKDS